MTEESIIQAIKMYTSGASLDQVLKKYRCSKSWLYKWLNRYKKDPEGLWYKELSRRPKSGTVKTTTDEKSKVAEIRQQLSSKLYSQKGAVSIQYEMNRQGLNPLPVWKINRILANAGLNVKPPKELKRTNNYPQIGQTVDQMDYVGPRFITGGGRYYSLNIIDTTTHFVHVNPIPSKETKYVLESLVRYWQQHGIADFLQMDNELSFRGSIKHPHSFGSLIRLALSLNVTIVFIPIQEPWRNGIVEKFNDSFNKRFIRAVQFSNIEDLKSKAKDFEIFHNDNHRYSAHQNRTPNEQKAKEMPRDLLPMNFVIPNQPAKLTKGSILLVRFIRSNLVLDIFSERFILPTHLVYSYVVARIDVSDQMLYVFRDDKMVWMTDYVINNN